MQVLLLKLTESTCGCCEMLLATVHRGFHAAQRGDRVSMVGSPHRPALSQPAQRRAPCVRPGLGEKGYIMGPWPLPLPCSSQLFRHKKMSGMEYFFFFNFTPKFPCLITRLSSWLRLLGKSRPSRVQKHVCAISHSIKIYLPSKHRDKLIQTWDLNSRLAVPFQIPALICDTGRIYISALSALSGQRNWPINLLPPLHMTSTSISHVFLPHLNGLDFLSSINIMPAEPTEQKGQAGIEDLRRPTDKTTLTFYIWLHVLHSLTFGSLYIRRHVLVKGGYHLI